MSRREQQRDRRAKKRAKSASALVSYEGPWSISLRHADRQARHYPWPQFDSELDARLLGRLAPLTRFDIEAVPAIEEGYAHRSQHIDGIEQHAQERLIELELQADQRIDTELPAARPAAGIVVKRTASGR